MNKVDKVPPSQPLSLWAKHTKLVTEISKAKHLMALHIKPWLMHFSTHACMQLYFKRHKVNKFHSHCVLLMMNPRNKATKTIQYYTGRKTKHSQKQSSYTPALNLRCNTIHCMQACKST